MPAIALAVRFITTNYCLDVRDVQSTASMIGTYTFLCGLTSLIHVVFGSRYDVDFVFCASFVFVRVMYVESHIFLRLPILYGGGTMIVSVVFDWKDLNADTCPYNFATNFSLPVTNDVFSDRINQASCPRHAPSLFNSIFRRFHKLYNF